MSRYTELSSVARQDSNTGQLAFYMARRFYYYHRDNPRAPLPFNATYLSKQRLTKRQQAQLTAAEIAVHIYNIYLTLLSPTPPLLAYSPSLLEQRILQQGNDDNQLDDVLSPSFNFINNSETTDNQEKKAQQVAFKGYQHILQQTPSPQQPPSDEPAISPQRQQQRITEKAESVASKVYDDYHKTQHSSQALRRGSTPPAQVARVMKDHLYQNTATVKAVASARKAGQKVGSFIASCTFWLPYLFSKARYSNNPDLWAKKRAALKQKQRAQKKSLVKKVGGFFAAISFTFGVLPALLLQKSTRRTSLGRDSTSQGLYQIFSQITDDKGIILDEYLPYARRLFRTIIERHQGSPRAKSNSCRKLLQKLQSQTSTESDKLKDLCAYMTTESATQSAIHAAGRLFSSRKRSRSSSDLSQPDNSRRRLYSDVEHALRTVDLTASPSSKRARDPINEQAHQARLA